MDELYRPAPWTEPRSVSPENFTGSKGAGGQAETGTGLSRTANGTPDGPAADLGPPWKISPSIFIAPGELHTLADIAGQGAIRHIWLTTDVSYVRKLVLRVYWDEVEYPSIEVPLGDFFCHGWDELAIMDSDKVSVAPNGGFNCWWHMPFRRHARFTLENVGSRRVQVYYSIDYAERPVQAYEQYLHTTWRRSHPLGDPAEHTLININSSPGSPGKYAGAYIALQPNAPLWWGEGEFKFFLDGDTDYPTICGTGTEDYVGGAFNFDVGGRYVPYAFRYIGLPQVLPADRIYEPGQRFGMYRWHIVDPIEFRSSLRVTMQALGWHPGFKRYRPLVEADIATTVFWYQYGAQRLADQQLDATTLAVSPQAATSSAHPAARRLWRGLRRR